MIKLIKILSEARVDRRKIIDFIRIYLAVPYNRSMEGYKYSVFFNRLLDIKVKYKSHNYQSADNWLLHLPEDQLLSLYQELKDLKKKVDKTKFS